MPSISGSVRCLQVSEAAAFTTIEDSTGSKETLILYFAPGTGSGIPTTVNSFTRILHSMWISQLREAMASNLQVTVAFPTGSAEVTSVQLGQI